MKFLIIRDFADKSECMNIRSMFGNSTNKPMPLNLEDGDDMTNTVYESNRSKCSYMYLDDYNDCNFKEKLKNMTEGLDFNKGINAKCLPIFNYGPGGYIKAHRGVNKDTDLEKYQEYVAVLMLSQRGVDYDGGYFYLNPVATASPDGKTVENDNEEDRFYPNMDIGDLIIFHNPSLVHGVTQIEGNDSERMTCSWRTNDIQFQKE